MAFAFRVIEIIHECFSTHAQALEEMNRDVTREDIERVRYLSHQARALIHLAAELSREQPRDSILADYRQALNLFGQALEELTAGNRDRALYLNNQGLACFRATEEAAGANRDRIVSGYKEAFEFYRQAVAAAMAGYGFRASYLNNQGTALSWATQEAAGANRALVVAGYKEASELFRQAAAAVMAGNRDLAYSLYNQGLAHFEDTKRAAAQ